MSKRFDIIVIGGGHAGIEAANAGALMGCSVALITMDKHALARMSCNPAIGGTAKGHLVREIDALGGLMAGIADRTGIQFRMLNRSKGPAVWSPRCQSDRKLYSEEACQVVSKIKKVEIIEDSAEEILAEGGKVSGVILKNTGFISGASVILSAGTFLNGKMHTGLSSFVGGRYGEKPALGITESLVKLGFESSRLKTGTPPRLKKESINWDILEEQPGDENPKPFSYRTDIRHFPYLPQLSCFITHTNEAVHKILERGFSESPLFTGTIKGVGPRYCPSIEDKIVRFSDKPKHQLFLEPEGLDSDQIYLNGFSTSLPAEIQYEAMRKIRGLENVEMVRPGYAVEYDYFPPHQVDLTLETKKVQGLYFAGQVNGTSGYEEAAAQGIVAGINAAAKITGKPELVIKRNEAYTGVLIDDLVTKSTDEPYRMFTSRAEYRLILRQDNADRRLLKYGYDYGLIDKSQYNELNKRELLITKAVTFCNETKISAKVINEHLSSRSLPEIDSTEAISKLCKRPELKLDEILQFVNTTEENKMFATTLLENEQVLEQVEIQLKYEGYLKRQEEMISKLEKYESTRIPSTLNYLDIKALSTEGREKLNKIKPRSIGQALRLSGVTHSDIAVLLVYLKN
ncbi:MAG: tRNA uridine-5-carboxymethylaminomethyl(34) synthesis enzyme MnmG [Ignavibacteriaceae bacterium]|nr:tRNA uridine-5-carboxymethylaminomethyl(34) synthesis enzyme MnmG [Ignavibacteriaceae bacterium]